MEEAAAALCSDYYRQITGKSLTLDGAVGCAKDFHRELDAAQARIKDLEQALRAVLDSASPCEWDHPTMYKACVDAAFVLEGKKGPVGKKPEVASPPPANETEAQETHD